MEEKTTEKTEAREREEVSLRSLFGFKYKEKYNIIKKKTLHVPAGNPHYVFPEAQTMALLLFLERPIGEGSNVYISGPSGVGKTDLVKNVANKLNWPVTVLDGDSFLNRSHMMGVPTVKGGELGFLYGPVPTAAKKGHILLINEYDTLNPIAVNILKPLLDNQPSMTVMENGNEIIRQGHGLHADFRIVVTANTWGRGDESGMFVNTHIQSAADLRRFHGFIELDYLSPEVEKKILSDMFSKNLDIDEEARDLIVVANKIREAYKARKINRTFSPSELINWARTYVSLNSVYEAARLTFLNAYSPDEKIAVAKMIEEVWGVEKTKDDPVVLTGGTPTPKTS